MSAQPFDPAPRGTAAAGAPRTPVWDLPTRVFHWLLALSFTGACLTAESERWRDVHVVPGYTVGGLLAFRLLWGVIGTRYARFSSLVFPPGAVLAYLRSLAGRAPQHFVGHNPAGALAIFAMLGLLAAATLTGWAGWVELGGEWLEDVHEALAQAALLFVGIHLAGVAVSSWLHRATGAERSCSGRRAARWRRSRDPARAGFADRTAGGVAWRVYSLATRDREVQIDVAQRVVDRRATARGGALRLLVPAVALALLLAGGSWLIVRRVTAPLVAFSGAIDALAPGRGAPVATSDLPSEMMPVGEAVNRLRNLMDDAIHHARAAVRIEAVQAGGRVVLAVRDDGPGMTAEQARRAFDRFYRSGAGGGSGLGLFLVRRIAKLHGGDARIGAGLGAAGVGIEVDLRAPGARQFTESREAG